VASFQPNQPNQPESPYISDTGRWSPSTVTGGSNTGERSTGVTSISEETAGDSSSVEVQEPTPRRGGRLPTIAVRGLTKTYVLGQTRVRALRGISLDIYPGEFVAIMGPSGSGKSTFMNLLGCLDRPTSGAYWLMGTSVGNMTPDQLADVRNLKIGFVFQGFNLLSRSSALENTLMPMLYAGKSKEEQRRRARRVLQLVGLAGRANHKPSQLSGGQQQRVAIARALVNSPALLLADEPTGNLDSRTSVEIMAILQALNDYGLTIILVTHEQDIAAFAKRQIGFRDGRVILDEVVLYPRHARRELEVVADDPSAGAEQSGSSSNSTGSGGSVEIREEQG
jgi:putative ABC transport system ATP-binding protein